MSKSLKAFRLSEETLEELKEIAEVLGISETEVVSRAIHTFYLQLKGEEQVTVSGSIVPFNEYQKTQERLSQALYKIGELEGVLKERSERLKEKDNLIQELRKQIEEYRAKPIKRWWEFWK